MPYISEKMIIKHSWQEMNQIMKQTGYIRIEGYKTIFLSTPTNAAFPKPTQYKMRRGQNIGSHLIRAKLPRNLRTTECPDQGSHW
jgi:hypothetical protein